MIGCKSWSLHLAVRKCGMQHFKKGDKDGQWAWSTGSLVQFCSAQSKPKWAHSRCSLAAAGGPVRGLFEPGTRDVLGNCSSSGPSAELSAPSSTASWTLRCTGREAMAPVRSPVCSHLLHWVRIDRGSTLRSLGDKIRHGMFAQVPRSPGHNIGHGLFAKVPRHSYHGLGKGQWLHVVVPWAFVKCTSTKCWNTPLLGSLYCSTCIDQLCSRLRRTRPCWTGWHR